MPECGSDPLGIGSSVPLNCACTPADRPCPAMSTHESGGCQYGRDSSRFLRYDLDELNRRCRFCGLNIRFHSNYYQPRHPPILEHVTALPQEFSELEHISGAVTHPFLAVRLRFLCRQCEDKMRRGFVTRIFSKLTPGPPVAMPWIDLILTYAGCKSLFERKREAKREVMKRMIAFQPNALEAAYHAHWMPRRSRQVPGICAQARKTWEIILAYVV